MAILVSEASNRYTHLFLVERKYFGFNTLECYCWIIMKYLAYMNILFGDITCKTIEIGEKVGMPWGTTLVLKSDLNKSCRLISTKNATVKNIHMDIIAPNFTNFYRRIFKIMFFMDGTQKKWNCQGRLLHTHPLLFLYLWLRFSCSIVTWVNY